VFRTNIMKIISAISGIPSMSEEEVGRFLESKLNLQIGTIDEEGDPNIQPVWFGYDKEREKLIVITAKVTKKVRNLRSKPNVYLSIDDENYPYKGLKGKGMATIIEDPNKTVTDAKKMNMKYLGTLNNPISKMILDSAQKGNHIVIELDPKFFSTWDIDFQNAIFRIKSCNRNRSLLSSYSISVFWLMIQKHHYMIR
jgi:nitroimidazol reductase NimA-like FMN-containing flavoprotein (pyridoxamine 5'-phosphate oxidase superfamily)